MAITLADFTKIWASTSPLTPYSFSDANYQEGWNFVGSTPPARQMWDFIQKNNDEKLKYIVDNFLPLSGGTMTGEITFAAGNKRILTEGDSSYIGICSGESGFYGGGNAYFFGKGYAEGTDISLRGAFRIGAVNADGTSVRSLLGKSDGTLTWGGKAVITGTEYSQTFTTNKLAANAEQNFTLTKQPKYWSVICISGGGWNNLLFAVNAGKTLRVTNKSTSTLSENVNFTINYIA